MEECCRTLARSIGFIAGIVHKRAQCTKFSWVSTPDAYSYIDLVRIAQKLAGTTGGVLSKSEKRDLGSLARELATGFKSAKKPCAYCAASHEASLVWILLTEIDETVASHDHNGGNREVVVFSKTEHLHDDAVCRVLYCNHPKVTKNINNKGYVSQAHHNKHFLDTNNANCWVEDTDKINSGYGKKVSKFIPGITYESEDYKKLECSALLDAMRNGKYSLERTRKHIFSANQEIGASNGEMTHKICIDTCNRDVHLYPVPETTPNN